MVATDGPIGPLVETVVCYVFHAVASFDDAFGNTEIKGLWRPDTKPIHQAIVDLFKTYNHALVEPDVAAIHKAEKERDALAAEVASLRDALKPFAQTADELRREAPFIRDDALTPIYFKVSDLNKAREAEKAVTANPATHVVIPLATAEKLVSAAYIADYEYANDGFEEIAIALQATIAKAKGESDV